MTTPAAPGTGPAAAHDVTDLALAPEGVRRIEWAEREMPVPRLIRERFAKERPLQGIRISACLHVTTETANLMRTLQVGGADVVLTASKDSQQLVELCLDLGHLREFLEDLAQGV